MVAFWLIEDIEEVADCHNAKDIWKQLLRMCTARAIKNFMVLILNWLCGLLIRVKAVKVICWKAWIHALIIIRACWVDVWTRSILLGYFLR